MSLFSITCLCLTRNRREWLPQAIACFQAQTYGNRRLLIVADGDRVEDLVPFEDERISLWQLDTRLTVGAKRNYGVDLIYTDLVCHWDDDDYSAPGRLAAQVAALEASGKAVGGYHSMKFTDGKNWWQYKGAPSFALGTSLLYRRDWWAKRPFADMQIGQDEQFAMDAASQKQLLAEGDLDLMYATIHAGNTSPRATASASCWQPLPGFQWRAA